MRCFDLGIDQPEEAFVKAVAEHKPQVLALSGFLSVAFDSMKSTIEQVEAAGLRDDLKIIIGGGQMDDTVRKYTGADAYGDDAMAAVAFAKEDGGGGVTWQTRAWDDMTPDERRAWRIDSGATPDVPFASPEAEADYKARVDRILAAINLREARPGARAPQHGLLAGQERRYHRLRGHERPRPGRQGLEGLQPEVPARRLGATRCTTPCPAPMFEALDYKLYSWPGHGVAKTASYQYNEKEWMLAEEYDHLISDPTDYLLRTYLPRTVGAFAGFGNLSSLFDFIELPFVSGNVGAWGTPEMAAGLEQHGRGGRSRRATGPRSSSRPWVRSWRLGFPATPAAAPRRRSTSSATPCAAPRASSSTCSGSPDKVLAACERLVQVAIDWALKQARRAGDPVCLHAAAQGCRRLHERRAVPHLLLADPARRASSVSSTRA